MFSVRSKPSSNGFLAPKIIIPVAKTVAVTSTSREASESALWALKQGGNAADAYLTATLTQTVVEHGLTSIGGGFSIKYFDAVTGKISSIVGPLGPAEAEPYDFERQSPVTQTGRAMPVPGFLSGLHAAHEQHGKLKWKTLFEPAIKYANDGFPASPLLVSAAGPKAATSCRREGAVDEAGSLPQARRNSRAKGTWEDASVRGG